MAVAVASGSGSGKWQVASAFQSRPCLPLPLLSLLLSHTLAGLPFSCARAKHCCLLARTQAVAGLDVFLNKCCG